MRSAEKLLADQGHTDDKGLALNRLKARYTAAAMLKFSRDYASKPLLRSELRISARRYAAEESWHKLAKEAVESLITIAFYDLQKGGRTSAIQRAAMLEVTETQWYRHYHKPYEALYGDLVAWACVGRNHAFRMHNADELDA